MAGSSSLVRNLKILGSCHHWDHWGHHVRIWSIWSSWNLGSRFKSIPSNAHPDTECLRPSNQWMQPPCQEKGLECHCSIWQQHFAKLLSAARSLSRHCSRSPLSRFLFHALFGWPFLGTTVGIDLSGKEWLGERGCRNRAESEERMDFQRRRPPFEDSAEDGRDTRSKSDQRVSPQSGANFLGVGSALSL